MTGFGVPLRDPIPAPLRTARLVLRAPAARDAARIAALANEAAVARMVSTLPHPYHVADAEAWIAGHPAGRRGDRAHPFAIEAAADGVIGVISLTRRDGVLELGYWLGRAYWGCGYATEAGAALLAWGEARGERAFTARHFVDNPASARVLDKLGFVHEGAREALFSLARGQEAQARVMTRPGRPDMTRA